MADKGHAKVKSKQTNIILAISEHASALITCTLLKSMLRAVNGSVRGLYPPGSLLSLSVVYGSMESSGSELQLTGLWSSPAAAMERPPTFVTHSLHKKKKKTHSQLIDADS